MRDATAVLLDGRLVLVGGLLVLVALAAGPLLARHLRIGHAHAFALVVSVGTVLGITLGNRSTGMLDVARLLRWEPERWVDPASAAWILNVALFVPATAFAAVAARRPALVAAVAFAVAAVIEYAQGILRLGTADQADLAANGIGALLGATIGRVWLRRRAATPAEILPTEILPTETSAGWTPRQAVVAAVALAASAAIAVVGIGAAADQRADDVVAALSSTIGDASSDDLQAVLERPDAEALRPFNTPLQVRATSIVHVDGNRHVVVRYPIEVLGARRCVVADIRPDGTTLREQPADRCDG